jgi:phosphomethylpyrimidine synthase
MPEGSMNQNLAVSTGSLPASRKVYVSGKLHPEIRVPLREIDLSPTANEPAVRVYDSSGPYTDPNVTTDITAGLPPVRAAWIAARGDVEASPGRAVRPEDNGLKPGEASKVAEFDRAGRRPLVAKAGRAVTQLAYARAGIITPEMEYIAVRENLGRQQALAPSSRPTSTNRKPSR